MMAAHAQFRKYFGLRNQLRQAGSVPGLTEVATCYCYVVSPTGPCAERRRAEDGSL